MRALLREDGSGLKADGLRLANSPKVRDDVRHELNELDAYLLSAHFDEHAVALLTDVVKGSGNAGPTFAVARTSRFFVMIFVVKSLGGKIG
jgi:hypothetical protein